MSRAEMERGGRDAPGKIAPHAETFDSSNRRNKIGNTHPVTSESTIAAICAAGDASVAFQRLLSEVPTDHGLAFVILNSGGETDTLARQLAECQSRLQVSLARDGVRLMPNDVYVVPSDTYPAISSGRLRLIPAHDQATARMPVDFLLQSLAASQGHRGIGVLIPTRGEDGAEGLKAIKKAGGLTIVLDPDETPQKGRLSDAVLRARPDRVLSVAEVSGVLSRYAKHPYFADTLQPSGYKRAAGDRADLSVCVERLRSETGQDFGSYGSEMLQRQIERRMVLLGATTRGEYFNLLCDSSEETHALAADLLIDVTGFFRDADLFEALIKPLAGVIDRHPDNQPFRMWVSGCSTGEAAYSLSMFVQERIAAMGRQLAVQIFATDIDTESLELGRRGIYPESIRKDVTPGQLERFFIAQYGSFLITKEFRETVLFSRHDAARDPPFSRMDLVWCRKFAGLVPGAQHRILSNLHFALNSHGLLLLDSAEESLGSSPILFHAADGGVRIYRRRGNVRPAWLQSWSQGGGSDRPDISLEEEVSKVRRQLNGTIRELRKTNERLTLKIDRAMRPNEGVVAVDEQLDAMRQDIETLDADLSAENNKVLASRDRTANSQLMAAASHDLLVPLQAIRLLHGVLKDRAADQAERTTITKLEESVDHMIDLLDTILDVDQLEAGTIAPEVSDFSLASLLGRAADEFAPIATARGVKLHKVSSSVTIRSDRRLLSRMIGNLVSNAIKRSDRGKVLLGCRRRGRELRIEVWGAGVGAALGAFGGISMDSNPTNHIDVARIGLGLYSVRRVSQILGHRIEFHSGRATMLAVVVPAVDRGLATAKQENASNTRLSEPTMLVAGDYAGQLGALHAMIAYTSTDTRDIAIIDDEPMVRDALRAALEAERYSVQTYPSAEAFLSDAGHAHFRCLVVDLTLTGVNGLQLLNRLRLEHLSPPMIFVTGQADLPMAVNAMREGAADFLQKPVRPETLRESIARALLQGDQDVGKRKEREDSAARIASLTVRERQVMEGMLAGRLNKNIAADLGISRRTTEHHRQSVFRKMGTKSLAMLVRTAGLSDGSDRASDDLPREAPSQNSAR